MLRSPLLRILLPVLAVVLLAGVARLYLRPGRLAHFAVAQPKRVYRNAIIIPGTTYTDLKDLSIGPDRVIYSLNNHQLDYSNIHGNDLLNAIGPDGSERWFHNMKDWDTDGCVASAEAVYVTCAGGHLWSIGLDGKLKWEVELYTPDELRVQAGQRVPGVDSPDHSAPLISPCGDVCVLLRRRVVCYSSAGQLRWVCDLSDPEAKKNPYLRQVEFENDTVVGFQMGYDGRVYVATDANGRGSDDGLRIISPDGKQTRVALKDRANVDPYADLIIDEQYSGWTVHDHLWHKLWDLPVASMGRAAQVIKFDRRAIYVLTQDGHMEAFSLAGKLLWDMAPDSAELVAGQEIALAPDKGPLYRLADSKLIAYDRATGQLLWEGGPAPADRQKLTGEYGFHLTEMAVSSRGRAYCIGTGYRLYALGP